MKATAEPYINNDELTSELKKAIKKPNSQQPAVLLALLKELPLLTARLNCTTDFLYRARGAMILWPWTMVRNSPMHYPLYRP